MHEQSNKPAMSGGSIQDGAVRVPDTSPVPDFSRMLSLSGRGFVVLGAGQGIGRQTVHALASLGAQVICVDREFDRAKHVADEIDATAVAADVTDRTAVDKVFAQAAAELKRPYGVIDIVGIAAISALLDTSEEIYEQQHALVFKHVFLALQGGGRMLRGRSEGTMVFVGSLSGLTAVNLQSLYGAFKAGIHHLVKAAATELGPFGIRVNSVAPGPTKTPRLVDRLGDDWSHVSDATPLRRVADPADIASVIAFLASDLARHVTGQTIAVDGGASITSSRPALIPSHRQRFQ